ncbi:glucose-1-phosphate thymidylyltransferase [Streptomyces murinus]|uniref:glucose-1-phosphate thymidylyltransferase n=1 Tax=Streptomyces murinus TaxID=33900 RepID=UPI000A1DE52F|nr:glucose-1-phosphate thymidylyltransferase [Streptomyces murinus]WDO05348.1 glucose-1-phosphate thymidylyltransferase [Streptomyces murinus]
MKALVLAGGTGSRLRPLTHTLAKQLIPLANKPVVHYGIEAIVAAGISEIGVVVGGAARELRDAVGDGSGFGARITYLVQERPLGLAHAVRVARDWLGEDDFLMYLGDNYLSNGVTDLMARYRAERATGPADAWLLLAKVADPTGFGIAELAPDATVVRLQEKPAEPRSDLAVAGAYLFTPAVHEAIAAIGASARGELEITDAVQRLIDSGRTVRGSLLTGYWKDTGTAEDLLEANNTVLEDIEHAVCGEVDTDSEIIGPVRIGAGASIVRSRVVGPAVIGAGVRVRDSVVGPFTSVADGCRITASAVRSSILLTGVRLDGAGPVENSLLGRHAHVSGPGPGARARRLVLGDHSSVTEAPRPPDGPARPATETPKSPKSPEDRAQEGPVGTA